MNILKFFQNFFSSKKDTVKKFPGIVSAKVLNIQKHPNADRLRIVQLNTGSQIVEPVVCGAINFGANDIVALALPGASIEQNIHSDNHESFILGKAVIRGVESRGMICAAFELGLAKEPGQGIMLLKPSTELGRQFTEDMILS